MHLILPDEFLVHGKIMLYETIKSNLKFYLWNALLLFKENLRILFFPLAFKSKIH